MARDRRQLAPCRPGLAGEAIELYLETLPADERDVLLSREVLTTTVEVNA